ncbi:GNAT family N-acetyltransferase [Butyrivibrio sp. CB08]|uniref:GNAT family N-acetyltransferase n=1 Tax=Butyrivibrio sp. CB08 TaxID=2364879 RepID=UPI000EAA08AD|nr:GNAT family N-acetyltransferase [Butyrivibrio sp. CB08]RKM61083.1 GNAT family N-acetyltransferase [Butyrivibrio sp. CB08]
MIYRLGTMKDLDSICELVSDAIAEMERHEIYQWDELYPARIDFEQDIKDGNLYVVLEDNKLAAFYVISDESDEQYGNADWQFGDSYYVLHRFCVSPRMQNKGVGKAVLTQIEDQIRKMGYSAVRLDTFTENPYAQRLYRHNGYVSRGYANWRKGRFDLMEKKL